MTAWFWLILAGVFEVGWAVALRASDGFSRGVPAILAIALAAASLFLLSLAMRTMAASVAYPIWVGLGMGGIAAYGAIVLGEPLTVQKAVSSLLIAIGVVGLAASRS